MSKKQPSNIAASVRQRLLNKARPKGPGKSKLDKHREEIVALLKNGSTTIGR